MLPRQFGNPHSSLNPATACVHISSVGVGKYSGCKTFQSSWQTSVTMLETVDRPTRKEKAMVWWLSPVARYLKQELKVVYTIVLCGVLHGNSLFCDCLCNCTNIQVWQIINKMPFSFYNLIFSYFLRWNFKTKMEKFKRFLHKVQEVPERYDGTSPKKIRKMALESSFAVLGQYLHTSSNNLQYFRNPGFRNPTTGRGNPTSESRYRDQLSTVSSIVGNAATTSKKNEEKAVNGGHRQNHWLLWKQKQEQKSIGRHWPSFSKLRRNFQATPAEKASNA